MSPMKLIKKAKITATKDPGFAAMFWAVLAASSATYCLGRMRIEANATPWIITHPITVMIAAECDELVLRDRVRAIVRGHGLKLHRHA